MNSCSESDVMDETENNVVYRFRNESISRMKEKTTVEARNLYDTLCERLPQELEVYQGDISNIPPRC